MKKKFLFASIMLSLVLCYSIIFFSEIQFESLASLFEGDSNNHGELQVLKMLKDRPTMRSYKSTRGEHKTLSSQDYIWKWAVKAYNKKINGSFIEWDSAEPDKPSQYAADHTVPDGEHHGSLRLRKSTVTDSGLVIEFGFETLWKNCIFELINMKKGKYFIELRDKALSGQLNKIEFVHLSQKLEYQSLKELKTFFNEVWKPWSDEHSYPYDEILWGQNLPPNYEEWIYQYRNSDTYNYWQHYYDTEIADYLKNMDDSARN